MPAERSVESVDIDDDYYVVPSHLPSPPASSAPDAQSRVPLIVRALQKQQQQPPPEPSPAPVVEPEEKDDEIVEEAYPGEFDEIGDYEEEEEPIIRYRLSTITERTERSKLTTIPAAISIPEVLHVPEAADAADDASSSTSYGQVIGKYCFS